MLPGGGTVRVGPQHASGGSAGGGGLAKPRLGGSGSAGVISSGGGAGSRSSGRGGPPPAHAAARIAGIAVAAAAEAAAAADADDIAAAPLLGQDASRRGGAARGVAHDVAAEGGAASLALTRAARGAASGPPRRDAAREAGNYYALPVRDKRPRLPARSLALIESLRRCVPDAPHRSMAIDQTRRPGSGTARPPTVTARGAIALTYGGAPPGLQIRATATGGPRSAAPHPFEMLAQVADPTSFLHPGRV